VFNGCDAPEPVFTEKATRPCNTVADLSRTDAVRMMDKGRLTDESLRIQLFSAVLNRGNLGDGL
jgi:hypothetical protein